MRAWLRKWWPWLKVFLGVAIVVAIGRRFYHDLQNPELWHRSVRLEWLVASGVLYLLGLGFSAIYWYRLLRELGQAPSFPAAVRAYYIGHLGKYLPGKAWALFLRASLIRGPGVGVGIAVMTSFYEVLVTMASGVLLGGILFAVLAPDTESGMDWSMVRGLFRLQAPTVFSMDRKVLLFLALVMLVPVGVPILPPVFNRLVRHMSGLRNAVAGRSGVVIDLDRLPRIRTGSLVEGLLIIAVGWLLLGASLWAVLYAVLDRPPPATLEALGLYSAIMGLGYVAGFIIVLVPSGLGVREFFLTLFLVPEVFALQGTDADEARALAVFAVLLLRLVWTVAELIVTGSLYWLPGPTVARVEAD